MERYLLVLIIAVSIFIYDSEVNDLLQLRDMTLFFFSIWIYLDMSNRTESTRGIRPPRSYSSQKDMTVYIIVSSAILPEAPRSNVLLQTQIIRSLRSSDYEM